jgi:hypothetical protein
MQIHRLLRSRLREVRVAVQETSTRVNAGSRSNTIGIAGRRVSTLRFSSFMTPSLK